MARRGAVANRLAQPLLHCTQTRDGTRRVNGVRARLYRRAKQYLVGFITAIAN
jgi:hypothetical protein